MCVLLPPYMVARTDILGWTNDIGVRFDDDI